MSSAPLVMPLDLMPGEVCAVNELRAQLHRLSHQEAALDFLEWFRQHGRALKGARFGADWLNGALICNVGDFEWKTQKPGEEAMNRVDEAVSALREAFYNHLETDTDRFAKAFIGSLNQVKWDMEEFFPRLTALSDKHIENGAQWLSAYLARAQELALSEATPHAPGPPRLRM